jgi:hypothetical protein
MIDMGNGPKIICSDMGNGLTTLVPYGISADVSEDARRLHDDFSKLIRAFEHRHKRSK